MVSSLNCHFFAFYNPPQADFTPKTRNLKIPKIILFSFRVFVLSCLRGQFLLILILVILVISNFIHFLDV